MTKKIIILLFVALSLMSVACKNEEILPIAEQQAKLNNNVDELIKEDKYSHLQDKKEDYIDLLKNIGVRMPVGTEGKRTLLVFTWCYCPFCYEQLEILKDSWNKDDFNLILAQAELSLKDKLSDEDKSKAYANEKAEIEKAYKDHKTEEFLQYSIYKTYDMAEDFGIRYFPTLVYLDKNGKVINISTLSDYDSILEVFNK